MTNVSIAFEEALPDPRQASRPGSRRLQAPISRPLLRAEALRPWLVPMVRALALPIALSAPDGTPILSEGALEGAVVRHPVLAQGLAIAELRVSAGARPEAVEAVRSALAACVESREAIADFSRSLATAWKESNFLYDLSQMLRDIVDVEAAAQIVVSQLARVQRADHVVLALRHSGDWALVASPPQTPESLERWRASLALVERHEPGVSVDGDRCVIQLPLFDGDDLLGVLMLEGEMSLSHAATMKFLSNVGSQITQMIRLRYLIQARVDAAQHLRDMELGAEIQRNLLPQSAPEFPGVALSASCRPAQMVGGDAFDYHAHDVGLDLVIADVSGHGVGAGLLMSSYLGMVRTLELARHTPAELAAVANRRICREVGLSGHFVTACHARLSPDRRQLTYAMLGHPAPLLWRGDGVQPLPVAAGLPAGMAEHGRYVEATARLEPGDVVVFYTDGLVEARSPDGATFGLERLSAALKSADRTPNAILQAIFAACEAFTGGQSPLDDQTAIVLLVQHQE